MEAAAAAASAASASSADSHTGAHGHQCLGQTGMVMLQSASPAAIAVEVGPVLEQAAGVLAAAVCGQHLRHPQLVEVRARCVKHQRGALLHLKAMKSVQIDVPETLLRMTCQRCSCCCLQLTMLVACHVSQSMLTSSPGSGMLSAFTAPSSVATGSNKQQGCL
jgi:hypothetical protein